jgi:PHD/YefM family antitoxin component YafN of YafNO toxin-antitoxin module
MSIQAVKLAGKRFVIIPEEEFDRLREAADQLAQDRGDAAEARRRKARGPARPYSQLRKKLGLA